jgi:hypothetical protein
MRIRPTSRPRFATCSHRTRLREQAAAVDDARPEEPDRARRLGRGGRRWRGRRRGCGSRRGRGGCRCRFAGRGARPGRRRRAGRRTAAAPDRGLRGSDRVLGVRRAEPRADPAARRSRWRPELRSRRAPATSRSPDHPSARRQRCGGSNLGRHRARRRSRRALDAHDDQHPREERAHRRELRPPGPSPNATQPSAYARADLGCRNPGSQRLLVTPEVRSVAATKPNYASLRRMSGSASREVLRVIGKRGSPSPPHLRGVARP